MLSISVLLTLLFFNGSLFSKESDFLENILALTSSKQGFYKAGESYFSQDGKKIIFQGAENKESPYQMYLVDLETTHLWQVSPNQGCCTCGFFDPLDKKIIFSSSFKSSEPYVKKLSSTYHWDLTPYMNIYHANYDGSNLTSLTSGSAYSAESAFSYDGKEIVFASNESGSMNLYVMDRDGKNKRQLTFTTTSYNGGPFFSPDNSSIIFRSDRRKKDYLELYLIDKISLKETRLTDNHEVNWAPFFHPSGEFIVYTRSSNHHKSYHLFLLHLETKEELQITTESNFNGLASFSLDGKKITWTSKREDGSPQIFIADFLTPKHWIN